jgi:hypothetical protein
VGSVRDEVLCGRAVVTDTAHTSYMRARPRGQDRKEPCLDYNDFIIRKIFEKALSGVAKVKK